MSGDIAARLSPEVTTLALCWRIVRDFKQADQSWDPRAAMALRDQNESTRASPS